MAKCAIFVTNEQQEESARAVLRERGEDIGIYMTHPLRVHDEAMDIVRREGIQVIIARGGVALEFKKCTEIPVIDLVLTVQELGMLLIEAKAILKKPRPTIALITYENMVGDMSDVEVLFGVKLRIYYVTNLDEMRPATLRAANDGADLAIGGIYVKAACEDISMPYLSNPAGKASVRHALQIASRVSYSIDLQERDSAEQNALLNFAFNGIMRLDRDGRIVTMNRRAESMLELSEAEARGRHISDCIPAIDPERLEKEVFGAGDELFLSFRSGEDAIAVSIAPIQGESAIVSCFDIEGISSFEREARSELQSTGPGGKYSYKWLSSMAEEHTPYLKSLNDQAQVDDCVLISGGGSLERSRSAAFIHFNGLRREGRFCSLSAASYSPEEQAEALFGTLEHPGAIAMADGGTLFIDELELLSPPCQQRLFRLLSDNILVCRDGYRAVDIRVIAGSAGELADLSEAGRFHTELYYFVSARSLAVPPLTGCPNAIVKWGAYYLERSCAAYGRFTLMTKAARRTLGAQLWPGGHAQLMSFCRRAAAENYRRVLDDTAVLRLLNGPAAVEPESHSADGEREQLVRLIEKYGGNRALMANELCISKTTLWRRMKQYGLM
ncbi:MAG: PrpR N-terminal domain-containing protein [Candidatus Heteroscillospira sp.]